MTKQHPRLTPILAALTPERLEVLVRGLAAQQPAGQRDHVSVLDLLESLLGGVDLGSPAEAWSAQLALKRAIADTAARIPGMQYVEGDS